MAALQIQKLLSSLVPKNFFWGTLLIGAMYFFLVQQYPADDFHRHLVAHAYDYNPLKNYPESAVTAYSQYFLYEHFLGWLSNYVSFDVITFTGQALAFALTYSIFYKLCYSPSLFKAPGLVASQASLIIVALLSSRMTSLRPEYFVFLNIVLFFTGASIWKNIAWLFVPFSILSYWLTPLWLLLLFAHKDAWKKNVGAILLIGVAHTLTWQYLSNGDWLDSIYRWYKFGATRLYTVGELKNFWAYAGFNSKFWVFFTFVVIGFEYKNVNWKRAVSFIGYNLLGYIRLVGAFVVCMLDSFLKGISKHEQIFTAYPWLSYLFIASMTVMGVGSAPIAKFNLPEGSRVLADAGSMYSINYVNPGKVEVFPAFELGASPAKVQHMLQGITDMSIKCEDLAFYKINYVIEAKAYKNPPYCMKLDSIYGHWRLWKISNTQN